MKKVVFQVVAATLVLLPYIAQAKMNLSFVAPQGRDGFHQILTKQYQNPIFQKIYNQLYNDEELTFIVATYTRSEYLGSKNDPKFIVPLGAFQPPDASTGHVYPQIGFWLEPSRELLLTECRRIMDITTFKKRDFVVFREFSHAAQWMYYLDQNSNISNLPLSLKNEMEIELLALITDNATCVSRELLKNPALLKFVNRFKSNEPFSVEDAQLFEMALSDIFKMLQNKGPWYKNRYTLFDLRKIKTEDFKFLYSLVGNPVNH